MDPGEEVFEVVNRWWRAWIEEDLETASRIEGARGVPMRSGRPPPQGRASISRWELSAPVTKLFDEVVVCSYAFRIEGALGRRQYEYFGHATNVLVKRAGHWCIVSHDGTFDEHASAAARK